MIWLFEFETTTVSENPSMRFKYNIQAIILLIIIKFFSVSNKKKHARYYSIEQETVSS